MVLSLVPCQKLPAEAPLDSDEEMGLEARDDEGDEGGKSNESESESEDTSKYSSDEVAMSDTDMATDLSVKPVVRKLFKV